MRNRFAGHCKHCRVFVPIDAGYFEKTKNGWSVRCMTCVVKGKLARGETAGIMSRAQREFCIKKGLDLL